MKKIGIGIPYYENNEEVKNRLDYLLSMLIEQTLSRESYYKIVVVDDGSNAKWLDEYDGYVEVIHLESNMGVSHARNVCLDYLIKDEECDYVGFIDADDSISNDYLQEFRVSTNMFDEYDYIDCRLVQQGIEVFGTIDGLTKQFGVVRNGVCGCLIKSSVIGDNRFLENLQIGEDSEFMKRVIDLSKHTKQVSCALYVYQKGINPDSLTMRHARGEIGEER